MRNEHEGQIEGGGDYVGVERIIESALRRSPFRRRTARYPGHSARKISECYLWLKNLDRRDQTLTTKRTTVISRTFVCRSSYSSTRSDLATCEFVIYFYLNKNSLVLRNFIESLKYKSRSRMQGTYTRVTYWITFWSVIQSWGVSFIPRYLLFGPAHIVSATWSVDDADENEEEKRVLH